MHGCSPCPGHCAAENETDRDSLCFSRSVTSLAQHRYAECTAQWLANRIFIGNLVRFAGRVNGSSSIQHPGQLRVELKHALQRAFQRDAAGAALLPRRFFLSFALTFSLNSRPGSQQRGAGGSGCLEGCLENPTTVRRALRCWWALRV